jgi:hypothetical protein
MISPSQVIDPLSTGPDGVRVTPQLSVTTGGDGNTMFAYQSTTSDVGAMAGNGAYSIVTVCT